MPHNTTPADPTGPPYHSNPLMNLIVALIAPMFLGVSQGDLQMARMAAFGTINEYRARNTSDLIAIAQIVTFGLASLWAIGRAMDASVAIPDSLHLCRAATTLARLAETNRRAIRQPLPPRSEQHPAEQHELEQHPAETHPAETLPATVHQAAKLQAEPARETADDAYPISPPVFLSPAAAALLAAESDARLRSPHHPAVIPRPDPAADHRTQKTWANAMHQEASDLTVSLPSLAPSERSAASARAAALISTANDLLSRLPRV